MAQVCLQQRSRASGLRRDPPASQHRGTGFIRDLKDGGPRCAWSILLYRRQAKNMESYQRSPGCKPKKSLSSSSRKTPGAAGPRKMELPYGATARLCQEWTRGSTSAGTMSSSQFSTWADGVMVADGVMAPHALLRIGGGVSVSTRGHGAEDLTLGFARPHTMTRGCIDHIRPAAILSE
jgi:hypothetical protein